MTKIDTTSVEIIKAESNDETTLPLLTGISAGFPSPAADFMDSAIDLNRTLIQHPAATFCGRVKGESMRDAGIDDGDLLVIDKSLSPDHGKIAVCFIDGEFTLKRIEIREKELWLIPANPQFKPIQCNPESDIRLWGVVTYVIKKVYPMYALVDCNNFYASCERLFTPHLR